MDGSRRDADQQRREKLKKELAQCEKELKLNKTAGPSNSKNNPKSLLNTLQKASNCVTHSTEGKITALPVQGPGLPWDEIKDGAVRCSSSREELLYLNFIEDVTDEILKLGLFSNREKCATCCIS